MPQLTIDVPDTLMPLLTPMAEAYGETPEEFIVHHLSMTLENPNEDVAVFMASEDQGRLEDILEKRDKGPFITITDMKALKEEVMAKVRERLQQKSSHA